MHMTISIHLERVGRAQLIGLGAVVVALGVMWYTWQTSQHANDLPSYVASEVSFRLYQPHALPSGFALDKKSFGITSQVVTFVLTYDSGKKLLVSEQPKPQDFDFTNFYGQKLTGTKQIAMPTGAATIGVYNGSGLASIVTDQTWVLIRAPSGINAATFESIVRNLQPAS